MRQNALHRTLYESFFREASRGLERNLSHKTVLFSISANLAVFCRSSTGNYQSGNYQNPPCSFHGLSPRLCSEWANFGPLRIHPKIHTNKSICKHKLSRGSFAFRRPLFGGRVTRCTDGPGNEKDLVQRFHQNNMADHRTCSQ